jgi:hypothetical protein
MSAKRRTLEGLVLAFAAAVTACVPLGASSAHPPRPSKLAQAQTNHEYPAPPAPPGRVRQAAPTAADAVRGFATAYINWTAATVSARMRALAAVSVSQARAAMELAAAQTAGDYELERGGIANQGTVEAVAPLVGHADEYIVVTRERTTATNSAAYAGLRPAWHVALATAARVAPGQWTVSRWQPET